MSEKKFSKGEAIRFGWQRTKQNFLFFIVFFAIVLVIQTFSTLFQLNFLQSGQNFLYAVTYIASIFVGMLLYFYTIKIGLNLYDNEKIKSPDFLAFTSSEFSKFFLVYLLYGIMVLIGTILLIIPGIYIAIRYQFAMYLVVDKKLGVIEALKESGRITKGSFWNLFLFLLLIMVIIFAGAFAFLLGLLVAWPIFIVSVAYVYKKLSLANMNNV